MKRFLWLVLMFSLAWGHSALAQTGCESAFADAQQFTADVFAKTTPQIQEGIIPWDSTDWENIVRRVVGSSEFYLNNCADPDQPLAEQPDVVAQLAAMSLIQPPVDSVDVGGDFGDLPLSSTYVPTTQWIDLNGDGTDELVLHTQVPYFSQNTVYQIRGGLSIAFFNSEDGWQGQVIAPITDFVTDETGDHVSYAMTENNTLSVPAADQALVYFPAPEIQMTDADGVPLTAITLHSATPAGEAKELAMITWDGRFPLVKLRVAFDDWCYPGSTLEWEIRADGSVFVPSNGNEEGSPLHCGRTPEALFQWNGEKYVAES